MHDSFHMWINVWVAVNLCDLSLTCGNPITVEMSITHIINYYYYYYYIRLTAFFLGQPG